ncbi:MAG: UDP-N-acetylmuramate--L-alanine ligase [Candidatus Beckwithbacteria bacterium]
MNLKKIKSIHFTGIKGVGMTALALCAQDLGKKVSGSDLADIFPTDKILKKQKLKVKLGFDPKHLPKNCDLVIYTGAHQGQTNPEVQSAISQNIPVLAHAQALALFAEGLPLIAVAGVGGKTSTSAMIATVLNSAGFHPAYAVGVGNILGLNTPGAYHRSSRYFVAEADEYVTDPVSNLTPRFHYLKPYVAVITNLEYDHPDVYPNLQAIFDSFSAFIKPVPQAGVVVVNFDNPRCRDWLKTVPKPVMTYGFSPQADWQIVSTHIADQKQFIKLKYQNIHWPDLILNVPGEFNALNAVAAIVACHHLGVSQARIYAGLRKFFGARRRFEFIAEIKKIALYDDYAHHPSEIKALLEAAKAWLPQRRLIIIFQSHTYSRTKALLPEFNRCFTQADVVLINDIFASARETDNLGLTGKSFTQSLQAHHPQAIYAPDKATTLNYLSKHILTGDVIFTVGAGDNWLWHKEIIKLLQNR